MKQQARVRRFIHGPAERARSFRSHVLSALLLVVVIVLTLPSCSEEEPIEVTGVDCELDAAGTIFGSVEFRLRTKVRNLRIEVHAEKPDGTEVGRTLAEPSEFPGLDDRRRRGTALFTIEPSEPPGEGVRCVMDGATADAVA